jgi:hypothetical protein
MGFGKIINGMIIFSLIIFLIIGGIHLNKVKEESKVYKVLLLADSQSSEVSIIHQKARGYYEEAGFYYENQDYKNVESTCRLARGEFSKASSGYLDIKSELESSKINDVLIDYYIQALDLISEIELNLYEACEHFESASRYYHIYYKTDVPVNDISFDMGGKEIDAMNKKIDLHDSNIRKYNDVSSKLRKELSKRLE